MNKHSCENCTERHYACWDTCIKYQEAKKNGEHKVSEIDGYLRSKGTYYKTKYGWRLQRNG